MHPDVEARVGLGDLRDLRQAHAHHEGIEGEAILSDWEWAPAVQVWLLGTAVALTFPAQWYLRDSSAQAKLLRFREKFQAKGKGRPYAFQLLKAPLGSPISMLREEDGSYTACPARIDAPAQAALKHVYDPPGGSAF